MSGRSDSVVVCPSCGTTKVVSFAACLRRGWPTCCGATMTLKNRPSKAKIEAAVGEQFGALDRLRAAISKMGEAP